MATSIDYILTLRDQFSKAFASFNQGAKGVDDGVNKMNSGLSKIAAVTGGIFAIGAIKQFAGEVLNVGMSYESMRIQLNNLTGSAEEGNKVFNRLEQDAKTSTFGVEELVKTNAMMMSTGLSADKAREDMINLGNAVNYAGKGNEEFMRMAANMQQIKNIGKASALDIKQFGFAGINIYKALADATGKSTEEVKGMEVSYDLLSFALSQANKEGGAFAGGSASMAKSTAVVLSNLGDSLKSFYDKIFRNLKPVVLTISDYLQRAMDWAERLGKWVKENLELVKAFGVAIGLIITYYAIMEAWQIALALTNPFTLMVVSIGVLLMSLAYLYQKFEFVRVVINGMVGALVGVGQILLNAFMAPFKIVWSMLEALRLIGSGDFMGAGKVVKDTMKGIKSGIDGGGAKLWSSITTADKTNYLAGSMNSIEKAMGTGKGESSSGMYSGPINEKNKKGAKTSGEVGSIAGGKPTSITINIDSLIKENVNQLTNVGADGLRDFEKKLVDSLLRVVNDSQIALG
jgi:hypothetical protein